LKVETTTVGRVEDNAFQLPDGSVSSHHCEVILRGNDVVIRDLNSTNGTFINGEQITGEAVLQPSQMLRLGNIELRLETAPAPAPAKKVLDRTQVMNQGVKASELETSETKTIKFDKHSPFQKKSNKSARVFILVGVLLFIVIVVAIVIAIKQLTTIGN
jgi:pSer/pThr/pTyr-binding forkhead associated (FHA) protein